MVKETHAFNQNTLSEKALKTGTSRDTSQKYTFNGLLNEASLRSEERFSKKSLLEAIVFKKGDIPAVTLTHSATYPPEKKRDLSKEYDSGATLRYVSPNSLPAGVLGMYEPTTHTITIANNLSGREELFVRKHESGHALGIIDETQTDAYAAGQTGYNLRGIGTVNYW